MNCPYCNKILSSNPNPITYNCFLNNDKHEFSCGDKKDDLWYLLLDNEKIQVGKYPGGHYILFKNKAGGEKIIKIEPFAIEDSLLIIDKYKNLRAFS
jgi:hypothetical protein